VLPVIFSFACKEKVTTETLKKFAATESYPTDSYLDTVQNKRALVIVAHDDDDCIMSGTLAMLKTQGWIIKQYCLEKHQGVDPDRHPSELISNGSELILSNDAYRVAPDTLHHEAYPMSYAEIDKQFYTAKVATALTALINQFSPSVIFTLDDVKGGYGHPDHVFISRLVADAAVRKVIPCMRIYQVVYTPHMENEIVFHWLDKRLKEWGYPNHSLTANRMYNVGGMPEPTVQVNISKFAHVKMKYLLAYNEDVRKNFRQFIPYYEEFDAETYFGIFDREFFRVINIPM
jgi:LmbE family N-acetylglucosaminyl deacetylase